MSGIQVGDTVRRKPKFETNVWLHDFSPGQEFIVRCIILDEILLEGSPFGWILDRFELVQKVIDLDGDDDDCV